jgi:rhodanese-related sulfurtransferase
MTSGEVRSRWRQRQEVALFDARDEAPFAEAHPFFAVSLPSYKVETCVFHLVPRRSAPIVVYDGGEGFAGRTAARLRAIGYTNVSLLEDGLAGWAAAGGELFRDVNVPSKAFGELVEATCHTPSLSASEVHQLMQSRADMVVLDVRRFSEYQTMNIPTSVSAPGGELVLRARDAAPSPETLIVVNCAGRTRSIIGAQSLLNAGIPNRVAALCNGTIGWTLAGLQLERGQARQAQAATHTDEMRTAAMRCAARTGVRQIDARVLDQYRSEADQRTLYCLDVRAQTEYESGHAAGFVWAPGGQLVQATDEWIAVRGARIVLFDDDGVRANMTGSWLAQMGWDVAVLKPGSLPTEETGMPASPRPTSQPVNVYKRPYEGTDNAPEAMRAYIEWELRLVEQIQRDGVANFNVMQPDEGPSARAI